MVARVVVKKTKTKTTRSFQFLVLALIFPLHLTKMMLTAKMIKMMRTILMTKMIKMTKMTKTMSLKGDSYLCLAAWAESEPGYRGIPFLVSQLPSQ